MGQTSSDLRAKGINRGAVRRYLNSVRNVQNKTGYTAVYNFKNNSDRADVALLTRGQMKRLENAKTVDGRNRVVQMAANGQSVG